MEPNSQATPNRFQSNLPTSGLTTSSSTNTDSGVLQTTVIVKPSTQEQIVASVLQNAGGVGLGMTISFLGLFLIVRQIMSSSNVGSIINSATRSIDELSKSVTKLVQTDDALMNSTEKVNTKLLEIDKKIELIFTQLQTLLQKSKRNRVNNDDKSS